MAKENKNKTYWPHMILGFLLVGITLGYWTVKSATSVPVQEENEYMLKYQKADTNINQIMDKKIAFDKAYLIQITNVEMQVPAKNEILHRKQKPHIVLAKGVNRFVYEVKDKEGNPVPDANVTFLLTRPHTDMDDISIAKVPFQGDKYIVENINIQKPGRYILRLRAKIGDKVGYSDIPAYLKPE
ncbi:FIG00545237: hypothetical protein [hydrothermal vent metagenome]|uniref:YtkA-like domain-containing protein n=1 Tax=hydrothermal vent metagenome TaxID=652676 RepID=A0A1W1CQ44_9ZZZZ